MIPGAAPRPSIEELTPAFEDCQGVDLMPVSLKGQKGIFKSKRPRYQVNKEADKKVSIYRPLVQNLVNKQEFDLKVGKLDPPPRKERLFDCITGYVEGHTTDCIFHKALTCGKENCPTCGADYSITHQRRILRSYHYVGQMDKVGYMVITFPEMYWQRMQDKKVLSDIRNYIRRKLKRGESLEITAYQTVKGKAKPKKVKRKFLSTKISRGLMRWHWCGEDRTTWKPHLNILMECGYIPDWQLRQYKKDLSAWLMAYFAPRLGPAYNDPPAVSNINYGYASAKTHKGRGKIKHWLNYVVRSTAKEVKDKNILDTIYNYKNTGYFGDYARLPKKGSPEAEILAGRDPETGEKIIWERRIRPILFKRLYQARAVYMGAGTWCWAKYYDPGGIIVFPDEIQAEFISKQDGFTV